MEFFDWCSSTKCYIITDDESSNQRKKDLWGCPVQSGPQGSESGGWLRRGLKTSEARPFSRVSTNQRPVFRSRDQYWPIRGQGIGAGGWVEVTPPRPQSGLWLAGEAAQLANRIPALENNHRQLQYLAQGGREEICRRSHYKCIYVCTWFEISDRLNNHSISL